MTSFDQAVGSRVLALHQLIYEKSGGRIGERIGRAPMLLLRTTGRKSGLTRTAALLYHRDGGDYVVVGSKGRIASPDERRRLWPEMTRLWPQYDRYQSQTQREIPLVILSPTA